MTQSKPIDQLAECFHAKLANLQQQEPDADQLPWIQTCLQLCKAQYEELHSMVKSYVFTDKAAEIHFFKHTKPQIVGKYLFFKKREKLYTEHFLGCDFIEKEYLQQVIVNSNRFLSDYKTFYSYYRAGHKHHDEVYYLRGQYDGNVCPNLPPMDNTFSTSADGILAEIIAHELMIAYANGRLFKLASMGEQVVLELPCKASPTDVVELGYALFVAGFFKTAKTIREVMEFLSKVFRIDLRKYYDTFIQIKERKLNSTKFLDKLQSALQMHIDGLATG